MERMGTYREISEYDPYEVLDLCEALEVWADINDLDATAPLDPNDKGVDFIRL